MAMGGEPEQGYPRQALPNLATGQRCPNSVSESYRSVMMRLKIHSKRRAEKKRASNSTVHLPHQHPTELEFPNCSGAGLGPTQPRVPLNVPLQRKC